MRYPTLEARKQIDLVAGEVQELYQEAGKALLGLVMLMEREGYNSADASAMLLASGIPPSQVQAGIHRIYVEAALGVRT